MDLETARDLAIAAHPLEEYEHFGRPAYRIKPKKTGGGPGRTVMTLWTEEGHAVLMLNTVQQADLVSHHPSCFAPHPTKWGAGGATIAYLGRLNEPMFRQALALAFEHGVR